MVRAVTDGYAGYLRERHGGDPALRIRLDRIPLGVEAQKFSPAAPDERAARRRALGVADDEVMVLFVGRLAHHAKAHPFPMFQALAQAVRDTGQKTHLVLSGWAANDAILRAFVEGAREFAPNVRLTVVDGTRPDTRFAVWQAADVFTSLSDNIQETFGLVIIEAMASGLPVVATDWDGYRDLVEHGVTGYLVPTIMLDGATADTTARLIMEEINYDQFLAECSQAVAVDVAETAAAFARLLRDGDLRKRMGAAGIERVRRCFDWPVIIAAYEELWRTLEGERVARAASEPPRTRPFAGPANYPAPEHSFAGYPTLLLAGAERLVATEGASKRLPKLLSLPLTSHVPGSRATDPALIQRMLDAAAAGCLIEELDALLRGAGIEHGKGRATLAWMLKYDLLRAPVPSESDQSAR
jgi:hypothetical protein